MMKALIFMATAILAGVTAVFIAKYRSDHMPDFFKFQQRRDYDFNTDGLIFVGVFLVVAFGFIAGALL
jgi:hypothetical protein